MAEITNENIAGDYFWLTQAKQQIENSNSARNDAAAKIEKLLLWFWGLYILYFAIGTTLNDLDEPLWVLILLALPIIIIMPAYWLTVRAQCPVLSQCNPLIPSQIRHAYNEGMLAKTKRFDAANIAVLIAAISVAVALFSLSFAEKKVDVKMKVEVSKLDSGFLVSASGFMPADKVIRITFDSIYNGHSRRTIQTAIYSTPPTKVLYTGFQLKKLPKDFIVSAYWINKDEIEEGISVRKTLPKK